MVSLQCSQTEVVEDLVQDTFIRALELLPRYRGDAPLVTWLRGIALNLARTHRARTHRRRGLLRRVMHRDECTTPGLEAETESRRALRKLWSLLERLPSPEREAFALRRIEELSLEETATITNTAVSTISDRTRRAEQKLRTWLEEKTP